MPDVPPAPDELAALRAANARLRQVIEAKDAEDAVLRAQVEALRAEMEALRARLFGSMATGAEHRQVIDLPEQIRALVTEHRIISRRCPCGTVTAGASPHGVTAPVQNGPRVTAACVYLWHGQFLSRSRTCEAVAELFGVADLLAFIQS